ncbi:MAG: recombination mediator RecR [Phycisphaerales bacterium]
MNDSSNQPDARRLALSPLASGYPEPVERLIAELSRMPGIGRRTAERLAFYLLKSEKDEALKLARAIHDVKTSLRHCSVCFNITERDPCPICADPRRDPAVVLVVEQPKDAIALEQTGMYSGTYHVLMGRINALEGVEPEDLTIGGLLARVRDAKANAQQAPVREVILGLNPNLEGDGTALYLVEQLEKLPVTVSRLARGLPSGSQLEYANKAVLADAIQGRQPVSGGGAR